MARKLQMLTIFTELQRAMAITPLLVGQGQASSSHRTTTDEDICVRLTRLRALARDLRALSGRGLLAVLFDHRRDHGPGLCAHR